MTSFSYFWSLWWPVNPSGLNNFHPFITYFIHWFCEEPNQSSLSVFSYRSVISSPSSFPSCSITRYYKKGAKPSEIRSVKWRRYLHINNRIDIDTPGDIQLSSWLVILYYCYALRILDYPRWINISQFPKWTSSWAA